MNIKHTSTILIVLGLFLVAYGIYATHTANASLKSASQQVSITTAIQDIRLGMRTFGKNPCGRIREIYDEPDSSWYQINLQMVKQNSGVLNIELLRPQNWLDLQGIKSGNTIYLDLPEMGAVGDASVISVLPAPPIQQGQGNVVTGRFIHQAANCIDLYIDGQDNPIGCTDNHPFWSEDRQDFIPAGQLNQGECVLLYSGETARIAQKLPRPGPETVYNLEIWGEHVYCVGKGGVLVHNNCYLTPINTPQGIYQPHDYSHVLTKEHALAALAEKNGNVVAIKCSGEPFDHLTEVRNGIRGAKNEIKTIKDFLSLSNLDSVTRNILNQRLSDLSIRLDMVRRILGE